MGSVEGTGSGSSSTYGGHAPDPQSGEGRSTSLESRHVHDKGIVIGTKEVTLQVKAVDTGYNVQPESAEGIWNARGLNNNSWHTVTVRVNMKLVD